MHIQQAKKQIKNAIVAYNTKDKYGRYKIPVSKQRPVFLVGAPGIGKTAIMEQIAQELNLGFVSYSMTHHTRQSALGLPFIVQKKFGEDIYSASEYTMSEILASVYDEMEKTGKKEGILFLDEINCVSETLAPSMLQFLQYKTFGRHKVPEGWIVVTAGNPPEFNDSVREFDIAMLDRLKKIEVEPDFEIWKEFALQTNVHPVILSYLSIKTQYFYRITTTIDGKSFVTARAWDDLSQMISLYEENELIVDFDLISQYIQDEQIAKDFSNYYDLYAKYKSDYQVEKILLGKENLEIIDRARNAKLDERLSLISLLLSSIEEDTKHILILEQAIRQIIPELKGEIEEYAMFIDSRIAFYKKECQKTDTQEHIDIYYEMVNLYELLLPIVQKENSYDSIKVQLQMELMELKVLDKEIQKKLENVFVFFEKSFGSGQEMLILVSELTVRPSCSKYIYSHGCSKYYQYNKQLLFEDKKNDLLDRIDALNLLEFEKED
ncbi:MAG: MoxR family ATPase [Bacillota bacterium]|nr:MoxR family ATPase [Bacillota bacterium]